MNLQRPKATAERDVLSGRNLLTSEHQHVVIEVSLMNPREVAGAKRLRKIESEHFSAEWCVEGTNLYPTGKASGWERRIGRSVLDSRGVTHTPTLYFEFRQPNRVDKERAAHNQLKPLCLAAKGKRRIFDNPIE